MEKSSRRLWLYVHQGAWYVGRNFCWYLILWFFSESKYSQNIVPANNSKNKVDLFLSLKNTSLIISSQYVAAEKKSYAPVFSRFRDPRKLGLSKD